MLDTVHANCVMTLCSSAYISTLYTRTRPRAMTFTFRACRRVWKMADNDAVPGPTVDRNPVVYLTRIERFSAAHRLNRSVGCEVIE